MMKTEAQRNAETDAKIVRKMDREIKKADSAIASALRDFENVDVFQRQSLTIIMRMSYLKGMLESTKSRMYIHNLFNGDAFDE